MFSSDFKKFGPSTTMMKPQQNEFPVNSIQITTELSEPQPAPMDTDGKTGISTFQKCDWYTLPNNVWKQKPVTQFGISSLGNQAFESDVNVQKASNSFASIGRHDTECHHQPNCPTPDEVNYWKPIYSTSQYPSQSFSSDINKLAGGTNVKFDPVVRCKETCTPNFRYQNISVMSEYEGKSPEELRLEDYNARRISPCQKMSSDHCTQRNAVSSSLFHTLFNTTGIGNVNSNHYHRSTKENVKNDYNDSSLLEVLLNNIRQRLNLDDVSDETRRICEKLTNTLVRFTERTLEKLTVIILEDLLKNIKCKIHAVDSKVEKNIRRAYRDERCGDRRCPGGTKHKGIKNRKKPYRDSATTRCENYSLSSTEFDSDFCHQNCANRAHPDECKKKQPVDDVSPATSGKRIVRKRGGFRCQDCDDDYADDDDNNQQQSDYGDRHHRHHRHLVRRERIRYPKTTTSRRKTDEGDERRTKEGGSGSTVSSKCRRTKAKKPNSRIKCSNLDLLTADDVLDIIRDDDDRLDTIPSSNSEEELLCDNTVSTKCGRTKSEKPNSKIKFKFDGVTAQDLLDMLPPIKNKDELLCDNTVSTKCRRTKSDKSKSKIKCKNGAETGTERIGMFSSTSSGDEHPDGGNTVSTKCRRTKIEKPNSKIQRKHGVESGTERIGIFSSSNSEDGIDTARELEDEYVVCQLFKTISTADPIDQNSRNKQIVKNSRNEEYAKKNAYFGREEPDWRISGRDKIVEITGGCLEKNDVTITVKSEPNDEHDHSCSSSV